MQRRFPRRCTSKESDESSKESLYSFEIKERHQRQVPINRDERWKRKQGRGQTRSTSREFPVMFCEVSSTECGSHFSRFNQSKNSMSSDYSKNEPNQTPKNRLKRARRNELCPSGHRFGSCKSHRSYTVSAKKCAEPVVPVETKPFYRLPQIIRDYFQRKALTRNVADAKEVIVFENDDIEIRMRKSQYKAGCKYGAQIHYGKYRECSPKLTTSRPRRKRTDQCDKPRQDHTSVRSDSGSPSHGRSSNKPKPKKRLSANRQKLPDCKQKHFNTKGYKTSTRESRRSEPEECSRIQGRRRRDESHPRQISGNKRKRRKERSNSPSKDSDCSESDTDYNMFNAPYEQFTVSSVPSDIKKCLCSKLDEYNRKKNLRHTHPDRHRRGKLLRNSSTEYNAMRSYRQINSQPNKNNQHPSEYQLESRQDNPNPYYSHYQNVALPGSTRPCPPGCKRAIEPVTSDPTQVEQYENTPKQYKTIGTSTSVDAVNEPSQKPQKSRCCCYCCPKKRICKPKCCIDEELDNFVKNFEETKTNKTNEETKTNKANEETKEKTSEKPKKKPENKKVAPNNKNTTTETITEETLETTETQQEHTTTNESEASPPADKANPDDNKKDEKKQTENVLGQYRMRTYDRHGNETVTVVGNSNYHKFTEGVVFKNIRDVAPKEIENLIVIKNKKVLFDEPKPILNTKLNLEGKSGFYRIIQEPVNGEPTVLRESISSIIFLTKVPSADKIKKKLTHKRPLFKTLVRRLENKFLGRSSRSVEITTESTDNVSEEKVAEIHKGATHRGSILRGTNHVGTNIFNDQNITSYPNTNGKSAPPSYPQFSRTIKLIENPNVHFDKESYYSTPCASNVTPTLNSSPQFLNNMKLVGSPQHSTVNPIVNPHHSTVNSTVNPHQQFSNIDKQSYYSTPCASNVTPTVNSSPQYPNNVQPVSNPQFPTVNSIVSPQLSTVNPIVNPHPMKQTSNVPRILIKGGHNLSVIPESKASLHDFSNFYYYALHLKSSCDLYQS